MKKLLVILLIALVTCEGIEESFDDDIVLKEIVFSKIQSPIIKKSSKSSLIPELLTRALIESYSKEGPKVFKRFGVITRKAADELKEKGLWNSKVNKFIELGRKYGSEFCEEDLPIDICGFNVAFALSVIKNKNHY